MTREDYRAGSAVAYSSRGRCSSGWKYCSVLRSYGQAIEKMVPYLLESGTSLVLGSRKKQILVTLKSVYNEDIYRIADQ